MQHVAITSLLLFSMSALPAQDPPDLRGFAFRLFDAAAGEGNACLSPWSCAIALGMARAGAAGATARQMDAVLGLANGNAWRALGRCTDALAPRLITEQGGTEPIEVAAYELRAANAAWARPDQEFLPTYLAHLESTFGAPLQRADFTSDAARTEINRWVAGETKDRIAELFAPGQPARDTRLALVNCVYLNAPWAQPFAPEQTQQAPFHVDGEAAIDVPTMQRTGDMRYHASARAHTVDLPFRGEQLVMRVVVPKELAGVDHALKELADEWPLRANLPHARVELHLPKFAFEMGYSLAEPLARLGMQDAFEVDRADFTGMTGSRDLYISAVVQKTFVKVDEKSTEAAAATGVVLGPTSAPMQPPEPVVVRADRPFLFVIHARRSGTILFVGRVSDPR